jgi:hypothetical protein
MSPTRRNAVFAFFAAMSAHAAQQQEPDNRHIRHDPDSEDVKLPNGKSQKDAISKKEHEDAVKDAESLIHLAEELRDDLKHSGEYVVALSSVRKTEEIEKLARRIRSKLKG